MLNKLKLNLRRAFAASVKQKIKRTLIHLDIAPLQMVCLDASTICQLKCPACFMRQDNYGALGKGYLKFENFKKFIDKNTFIKHIELSRNGEIFLNPDLLEIIEYAYQKDVIVSSSTGVNFNTISEEMIEALVKYKFYAMTFSIDGGTEEVYNKYRVNGDFNKVIENIKKLQHYKAKYNSKYPLLTWQYIIMNGNDSENDIKNVKKIANELNINLFFKFTYETDYKPDNPEMIERETGLKYWQDNETFSTWNPTVYTDYGVPCHHLWYKPQINYDGRLLGCCIVYKDDFGVNVFEVGLKKALKSKNFMYAKKMLMGKVPPPKDKSHIPCATCEYYHNMLTTKEFI